MNWRFCVAPMLDWTDRHCRYFHRQLSRHARLYTEMVTTGALLHGDVARHLDFDAAEHPVALQLGGSDPAELAQCARLAARWGYDEINLNCGCPSERVQRGAFGACLMAQPRLVADCIKAMQDAVSVPVTVKHRLGIDRREDYGFVRDFVGTLFEAGCRVFIVHARNAWLKGLSPKENRTVPPLRYQVVYQLKRDFPAATVVLNGGIQTLEQARTHLAHVDGVMLGRAAWNEPYLLAAVDRELFGDDAPVPTREQVVERMSAYLQRAVAQGVAPHAVLNPMLNLFHGQPGARRWRQRLSDPAFLREHGVLALGAAVAELAAPLVT
ncbi:MAG: tRNA dihydrouridine(20/20a) synthase DusA [Sutterellaceae bacterium]|nr:tRNA dihydrouridine(20/20a) synthase DusA [Burkholderiaceae bacterium]MCX7901356.1 tRNA dihydrouridine(20/20a) synthase DusA [Burkholderiaceae bacterium]MDW8429436.1 tRNA dihydrouridine(20/20a) synthase DusA [Sutterellaceae bacterium]